jgi:hypothetical protein
MKTNLFIFVFLSASFVFGIESESECQKKGSAGDSCFEDENAMETGDIDENLNNFDQVSQSCNSYGRSFKYLIQCLPKSILVCKIKQNVKI